MANPRYHEEPDWYERPGETVHLQVDANPARYVVPALPWRDGDGSWAERMAPMMVVDRLPCVVCRCVRLVGPSGLCDYCARAQARDETHKARARQPQPSRPRIQIREAWESWASEQRDAPSHFETGHVREYETRIA